MAIILFYLNTVVINFMDYLKEEYILQSMDKKLPLKRDFIEDKFMDYIKNVLLWEFLLVLSLMLILYKIIDRMVRQERNYRDFLELILLTVSHKFGNFLASHKGNIEILKIKYDTRAVERLEQSYKWIHEDFQKILKNIEKFKEFTIYTEKINLREIIEKILSILNTNKEINLKIKDVFINANRQIVENIIFSLIENSFKYSKDKIYIRLSDRTLTIKNDIGHSDTGSGVGLKIAEELAIKEGFKIKHKVKGDYFISLFRFK